MIDRGHGLLPIAMDCLHYQENERPSSEDLCQRLAGLKEMREYSESVEQVEREQNDIDKLERQMKEIQVREMATTQQLYLLRDENQQQQQRCQNEIQSKDQQIHDLKQQLEEQEQVTAEIQQTNNSLQRQVEQLQQQLSQQTQQNTQLLSPVPLEAQVRGRQLQQDHSMKEKQTLPQQVPYQPNRPLILEWKDGGSAPYCIMARGAAVLDGSVAYFINCHGRTCSYDSSTQTWNKHPQYPYRYSSLAVIGGLVTAIGGVEGAAAISKLLSIDDDGNQKWIEHFPPMPTKRSHTAAATTKQHLIVAGGENGTNLNIVEVMDVQTLDWSTAASLPCSYSNASATICGGRFYMLGGFDRYGFTKCVLACSLTKLLQPCSETSSDSVWHRITDVPVYKSTCAAVSGELGGRDAENKTTAAVHIYNPTTDSWDILSNMTTARSLCLVAVLPANEIMVISGDTGFTFTDKVEIASVQFT